MNLTNAVHHVMSVTITCITCSRNTAIHFMFVFGFVVQRAEVLVGALAFVNTLDEE